MELSRQPRKFYRERQKDEGNAEDVGLSRAG